MSHRVVAVLLMVLPAGVAAQVPQRGTAPQRQALLVARGEYLAALGGCNDCHTPKIFRAEMMALDSSRLLAGYVANPAVPQIPTGVLSPSGWAVLTNMDGTAWAGPWGVSFAANLTPADSAPDALGQHRPLDGR
jgi:hypothetical protein